MLLDSQIHQALEHNPFLNISEEGINSFFKVSDHLKAEYQKLIAQLLKYSKIVFNYIFRQYLDKDIKDVILDAENDGTSLQIKLLAQSPETKEIIRETDARGYLNTFRFKMYCVSIKMSLAFCCKKLYNFNAPIVIDDVFDSSDFQNREKIREFIFNLYKAHDEIFSKDNSQMQLIFFTQDDVIGDSVFEGIKDFGPESGVKYARIYDYTEAGENDCHSVTIDDSGKQYTNVRIEDIIKICNG